MADLTFASHHAVESLKELYVPVPHWTLSVNQICHFDARSRTMGVVEMSRVWSDVIKVEADTSEVLGNGQVKSWVKTCVLSQEMVGDR